MEGSGTSWADQWGTGKTGEEDKKKRLIKKSGKKMDDFKKVASAGFVKAKAVAVFGAKKVKTGTSLGIKWIKDQSQKRKSSK
ncbi:unnamed protein product [Coffea canephora]|mgnify:FL=1|uniref:Uncharacterized protein n=1 Tax=Coffea canephora TaxID=49390 RepID=A0A068UR71_COFCA|nr:unnamed protein product [Coffea canephora]